MYKFENDSIVLSSIKGNIRIITIFLILVNIEIKLWENKAIYKLAISRDLINKRVVYESLCLTFNSFTLNFLSLKIKSNYILLLF
jgi:hypothetical protein